MTLRPDNHLKPAERLACPRDGEPMRRWTLEGVEVDRCTVCAGIWLDAGELERLLGLSGEAREDLGRLDHGMGEEPIMERDPRRCPRDDAPLREVTDRRQQHIAYDVCDTCGGMFFDTGELQDLSRFTLEERVRYLLAKRSKQDANPDGTAQ